MQSLESRLGGMGLGDESAATRKNEGEKLLTKVRTS